MLLFILVIFQVDKIKTTYTTKCFFNKSTFFDCKNGLQVKFKDTEDYEAADYDRITAKPQRLFLKDKLEYDIIKTTKGIFFLSEIINEFQERKITGYQIIDGILET